MCPAPALPPNTSTAPHPTHPLHPAHSPNHPLRPGCLPSRRASSWSTPTRRRRTTACATAPSRTSLSTPASALRARRGDGIASRLLLLLPLRGLGTGCGPRCWRCGTAPKPHCWAVMGASTDWACRQARCCSIALLPASPSSVIQLLVPHCCLRPCVSVLRFVCFLFVPSRSALPLPACCFCSLF